MAAKKTSTKDALDKARKVTKKNTGKTSAPKSPPSKPDKGKEAAKEKARTFMDHVKDEDKVDAITKGIRQAVTAAKETVKELKTNLDLIQQTAETKDVHFLLELARRTAGETVQTLQEEITKAKKKTQEAGFKW